jgi:hypothetical protein
MPSFELWCCGLCSGWQAESSLLLTLTTLCLLHTVLALIFSSNGTPLARYIIDTHLCAFRVSLVGTRFSDKHHVLRSFLCLLSLSTHASIHRQIIPLQDMPKMALLGVKTLERRLLARGTPEGNGVVDNAHHI